MRLTLRTLLAYLDDTLEPTLARQIGQKLAESDVGRELVERIKQLTARQRLTVPPETGPGAQLDPNTLAEYLDNELPPEKLSEVEQMCLSSDSHLAEVAACHQILTLVLGQPSVIPPTAKQRMYVLAGRSRGRRRQTASAAANAGYDHLGDEGDETLLLGLPAFFRQHAWARWLAPILGVFLLAGILVVAIALAMWQSRPTELAEKGKRSALPLGTSTVAETAPAPITPEAPVVTPPEPKPMPEPVKPPTEPVKPLEAATTPTNTETTPPAKPTEPTPATAGAPAPNDVRRSIARFINDTGVLASRRTDTEPWRKLSPGSEISAGDRLVSLPGYVSEIQLDNGAQLVLFGSMPEPESSAVVLESSATIHSPDALVDLDVTLTYGRILLRNRKPKGGTVHARVRFNKEVWELSLPDRETEVSLQLWGDDPLNQRVSRSSDEGPLAVVDLFALKGTAQLKTEYQTRPLPAPCFFYWHSIYGTASQANPLPRLPHWATSDQWLKPELLRAIEGLGKQLRSAKAPLDVALPEALKNSNARYGILALFALGALDHVPGLLDGLEDSRPEIRTAAAITMRHWLHRSKEQDAKLTEAIRTKFQDSVNPNLFVWALHPLSEQDRAKPEMYSYLIEALKSPRLAVRELAFGQLSDLVPQLSEKITYDPAGPTDQREQAYKAWKAAIPEGKLPPIPAAPIRAGEK